MPGMLNMTGRYYRSLPLGTSDYETEPVELDASKTVFIGMHCWNIGCDDGPAIDPDFCVGMGYPDVFAEAERIMNEKIRPAMDAARAAGVLVAHVESPQIARQHPEAMQFSGPAADPVPMPPEVVPGWRRHIMKRSHGDDYARLSPYALMDRAKVVEALPGEPYVYDTRQFDRVLRMHGIENLIYSGFATDMCILRSGGGVEPMAPYGYRIFLMRDATLGVELPGKMDERIATQWGTAYFETHYGDTVTCDDFIAACKAITQ